MITCYYYSIEDLMLGVGISEGKILTKKPWERRDAA